MVRPVFRSSDSVLSSRVFVGVFLFAVVCSGYLIDSGFPCPRGDDAVYKSPAAELVQHGRFAVPCMVGFLPRSDEVFAHYPPVYQLLLAAWYSVFGFSLRSTLVFSYGVHILGTLALMKLTHRSVSHQHPGSRIQVTLVGAVGLIHFCNLAYFDRPEETALLWLWLEMLAVGNTPRESRRLASATLSGFLLGLAALTAPWVGVIGGCLLLLRDLFDRRPLFRDLFILAIRMLTAVGVVGVWYVAMEMSHPGIMRDQFFGVLLYVRDAHVSVGLPDRVNTFFRTLVFFPPQLPANAVALLFYPAMLIGSRKKAAPVANALYLTSLIGIALVAFVRPQSYPYLGVVLAFMLPCFACAMARFLSPNSSTAGRLCGYGVLAVCVAFASRDIIGELRAAAVLRDSERPDQVDVELRHKSPPDELVAVTPRHWHAFQGRNPWREAYLSSRTTDAEILRCKWLVLYPGVGIPPYIDAFELVKRMPTKQPRDRTYAYSLWKRR